MNERSSSRRKLVTGLSLLAALVLGGCSSLPDLKSFAAATGDIQTGVSTIGGEFAASIPNAASCGRSDANPPVTCKQKFQDEWKYRTDAIAAIADYSDALAQIVDAGNSGAESADRVMKSATGLLDVLNVAPLSSAITGAAAKALAELARYRALKSLDQAIDKAHAPISEVATLLIVDLGTLDSLVESIQHGIAAQIEATDKNQVGSQMRYAQMAVQQHRALMAADHQELTNLSSALSEIRANKPPTGDSCKAEDDCAQRLKAADRRIDETRTRLIILERDLQNLEKSYLPIRTEREAAELRAKKTRKAIAQLQIGLQEWIDIHNTLGEYVRNSLQPNARQLLATASDLKQIIDDLRKEQ